MTMRRFEVWTADLSPRFGTEPGKVRPVVIIQTDLLNDSGHPSTLICPITSRTVEGIAYLRVRLARSVAGMEQASDILVDQIRAIDNKCLLQYIGGLPDAAARQLADNLRVVLDL